MDNEEPKVYISLIRTSLLIFSVISSLITHSNFTPLTHVSAVSQKLSYYKKLACTSDENEFMTAQISFDHLHFSRLNIISSFMPWLMAYLLSWFH